jgi:hypothetical protein
MLSCQILRTDEDLRRSNAFFFLSRLVTVIHSFASKSSRKNVDGASTGVFNSGGDLLGRTPERVSLDGGEIASSFAAHLSSASSSSLPFWIS